MCWVIVNNAWTENYEITHKKLMKKTKKAIVNMIMKISPVDERKILTDVANILDRKIMDICDKFNYRFDTNNKTFINDLGVVMIPTLPTFKIKK